MASIQKRGETYLISVSAGYGMDGKQKRQTMTWKPDAGMTKRQEEKEVRRQAVLFEERVKSGQFISGDIRFADFAAQWMESYAKAQLRPKTVAQYTQLLPRVNEAMGHIRLNKIQPHHLLQFYENLAEVGVRDDTKYKSKADLKAILHRQKTTQAALACSAGVSLATVEKAVSGKNIASRSANKICDALNVPLRNLFDEVPTNGGKLSGKTIRHYHTLISSIFSSAVEWGAVAVNPCTRIKAPKAEQKEPRYLDEIEAAHLLDLLEAEPMQFRTMIQVLLYTGMRRGELLGLEWKDIDFDNKLIAVRRSSQYLPEKGIYDDGTKTRTSDRVMKCSDAAITAMRSFRTWQSEQRLKAGDRWQPSDRIFTTWDGKPLHPDTFSAWFRDFIRKSDLPNISIHSLRHTNATLQIAGGVPVTTVSHRLGHATANTTTRIYAHAIKSADEAAAEALQDILSGKKRTG